MPNSTAKKLAETDDKAIAATPFFEKCLIITSWAKSIPAKGEKISVEDITFTIESADSRRIKRVKLKINEGAPIDEIT